MIGNKKILFPSHVQTNIILKREKIAIHDAKGRYLSNHCSKGRKKEMGQFY
jgi:hypothetical protein